MAMVAKQYDANAGLGVTIISGFVIFDARLIEWPFQQIVAP